MPPASPHASSPESAGPSSAARILLIGGGQVGVNAALRLRARLKPGEAELTLVDPTSYMTYQPFLAEAASGAIDPRHVVVPLRRALRGVKVMQGRLTSLDQANARAHLLLPAPVYGASPIELTLPYDLLVLAPGSVSRILPVPGLAEHGIGFRSVEEAVKLRNHVLSQLDVASSTRDPELRQAALTFVFVGGGYAGTGALAELEDMARHATSHYHNLRPEDLRWVLVEAGKRILPETEPQAAERTTAELRERAIDVRLGTRLASVGADGTVQLTDGSRFAARTLVWTAGVRANPVLKQTGLAVDAQGRLRCDSHLRVLGTERVFAAGDSAAVPDLARPGETCRANAQHAVHQAMVLADNLVACLRGQPTTAYRRELKGTITSLGLHQGVAQLRSRSLHGRSAWLLHRAVHLRRVPTWERKARVMSDWLLASLTGREIVSLGELEEPRAGFEHLLDEGLSEGGTI
ncbi:NAD(P)/FAD-dependent oxidoreductase [Streptacidiphilus sp. MAP5-3]|uniref:NAD(P)/FAD-dependent oxidoreductase n=1 Tax=unclassified Streptacidiphilus TaxID=2643834 RepID=UPI0035194E1E